MNDPTITLSRPELKKIVRQEIERFARTVGLPYDPGDLFDGFDFETRGWNPVNALCLARASVLTYQPQKTVKADLKRSRGTAIRWLEDPVTDTQGFACAMPSGSDSASEPAGLLVAFRGTESKLDVKIDVQKDLVAFEIDAAGYGRVHKGFKKALEGVWPQVEEFLFDKRHAPGLPVWFTGHSLGGALATLCCARVALGSKDAAVGGLYTFGQPRVGDAGFKKAVLDRVGGDRICRVYRCADPVPMLPKLNGYKHVSGLQRCYISRSGAFELGGSGRTKVVERLSTWALLAMKVASSGGQLNQLRGLVSDHYAEGYLGSVRDAWRKARIEAPQEEEP